MVWKATTYWRTKQALEVDGKLYCQACPLVYVPHVHNPGVHERFYGLDLKRKWSFCQISHGGR